MGLCRCFRCGEELTAPVFIDGRPYGWSCAKIVRPGIRKPKTKEAWVLAESVETILEFSKPDKRKVRATLNGKGYIDWHWLDVNGNEVHANRAIVIDGDRCYVNLSIYKRK